MTTKRSDPVRDWLRARGCPAHIVRAGVPGLVERWQEVVHSLEDHYPYTLDDYLNDMDTRTLLAGALGHLPKAEAGKIKEEIAASDKRFRMLTEPLDQCLWGEDVARDEGWEPEREWWYWRRPRDPGPDLEADLAKLEDGL
ncbi:MAG TPA: hypothetical protein VFN83_06010 [Gemmatimonadales bacterium]|jgi:hypothetical protein|nr:hypothetical protein [Gemmatimonadales bacterium]